jgi:hypothetical protein
MSRILGKGWYLGNTQAHTPDADPELVEHGQLWALHLPEGSGRNGGDEDGDDRDHGRADSVKPRARPAAGRAFLHIRA